MFYLTDMTDSNKINVVCCNNGIKINWTLL